MLVLPTPASPIRITMEMLELDEKDIFDEVITFEQIVMIMSNSIHFFF